MSQHDYDISNGGGAAVRADINAALLAILTQNSGATAPAVTKPFMLWYDTANSVLKQRNAADTAWGIVPFSFDANGQVAIGSASPLLPGGSPTTRGELSINGSTDSFVALGIGGVIKGYIGQTANGLQLDSEGATSITAVVNGAERIKIDSSVLSLSGLQGIKFQATQSASSDANTLDDYEEGTFTPSLGRLSAANTVTYGTQQGKYTKIGNIVYISIALGWTANSGGAGAYTVNGLPFTSTSGAAAYTQMCVGDANGITFPSGRTQITGETSVSNSRVDLLATGSGVNSVSIDNLAGAGYIYMTGYYYVS